MVVLLLLLVGVTIPGDWGGGMAILSCSSTWGVGDEIFLIVSSLEIDRCGDACLEFCLLVGLEKDLPLPRPATSPGDTDSLLRSSLAPTT